MAAVTVENYSTPKYLRGIVGSVLRFRRGCTIYAQGDPADAAFYLLHGMVIFTINSPEGKEAVVETLGGDNFFGDDCIIESARRPCTATALDTCLLIRVEKSDLYGNFRRSAELSEAFLQHLVQRNRSIRENLAEHLFSSSERRLLRTLLTLAHEARMGDDIVTLPKVSQSVLASMVGTTRSRISYFLGRFRGMGLIEYDKNIRINQTLIASMLRYDINDVEPERYLQSL